MESSSHNIISRIKDTDKYFIINLLSQEADILNTDQYQQIQNGNLNDKNEFIKKGYLVEPALEKARFRKKYLEFLDNRDQDEVQLFFVPGYGCNFQCPYCYQDEYLNEDPALSDEIIEGFFHYIDKHFYDRNTYITLFGGEPLLNSNRQKKSIGKLLEECDDRDLDVAIVTNGYFLEEYLPLLDTASIREIQVTLDGVGEYHDRRRPLKGGGSTFSKIVQGIDAAMEAGHPINLRMVVDKENLDQLPALARFAIDKKWTSNPLFKTQLGRNYELHHCQMNSDKLYTRIGLYEDIYQLIHAHPEILEFHKPAFSISKFLFEEGNLPDPLFDSCPGTKTEWAFDYSGKIYSCTATVGKEGEELGTFYPDVRLNEERIEEWESRDILAIEKCRTCNLSLVCGGGCASVAKNQTGKLHSPDCRPVKELLELGIATYFREELDAD